jgi:hypothetical protein
MPPLRAVPIQRTEEPRREDPASAPDTCPSARSRSLTPQFPVTLSLRSLRNRGMLSVPEMRAHHGALGACVPDARVVKIRWLPARVPATTPVASTMPTHRTCGSADTGATRCRARRHRHGHRPGHRLLGSAPGERGRVQLPSLSTGLRQAIGERLAHVMWRHSINCSGRCRARRRHRYPHAHTLTQTGCRCDSGWRGG